MQVPRPFRSGGSRRRALRDTPDERLRGSGKAGDGVRSRFARGPALVPSGQSKATGSAIIPEAARERAAIRPQTPDEDHMVSKIT